MRLCFINPNSTASMTEKVAIAARAAASPGTEIVALTSPTGPASIQGPEDGDAAVPGLLALIAEHAQAMDGFAIACFDDTGLFEARRLTTKPVVGIGEAAFLEAMEGERRFSVVTTLSVSIPVIAGNIEAHGFGPSCATVRASEVPVLALEKEGSAARETVAAEIGRAVAEDAPDAIVLGCAGMADLAEEYTRRFGLPVIDGVVAAVGLLEARILTDKAHHAAQSAGPFGGCSMTTIEVIIDNEIFPARLETEAAPKTVAAMLKVLPYSERIIHVRWSGEACWIPLGDLDFGLSYENATSHPAPGQMILYPGGVSETEILLAYGPVAFASKAGPLAGNHFLTITDRLDVLARLGRETLWTGAKTMVLRAAEA